MLMCIDMDLNIICDRFDEKVLCPKVKHHAKQDQGCTQHTAVPERQAGAQSLEQSRTGFL
jgi:hypothetical protein